MNLKIVLVGVGGGGILFATKVLAETARRQGRQFIGSETHGMSQRGGSVVSHLKLGEFQSPTVRRGTADVVVAFDADEAHKSLDYLIDGGACIVNAPEGRFPNEAAKAYLVNHHIDWAALDANAIALEAGALSAANVVLLGFAAARGALPFSFDQIAEALNVLTGEKRRADNHEALQRGAQIALAKEEAQ